MSSTTHDQAEWSEDFIDICSYDDSQVHEVLSNLTKMPEFTDTLSTLFPALSPKLKELVGFLQSTETISELQTVIETWLFPEIRKTFDPLVIRGLDNLDPNDRYLFISNHRDIVMDPLLLNLALRQGGHKTAHCAIGDNLLQNPIALHLAKLNQCFKVIRSLKSPKAILKAMKVQSRYIRHLSDDEAANIWIAQKEGRAKDNNDKTNPALIKMLMLAKPKDQDAAEYINKMNIVPICFSYEWDPCDIDKALQLRASQSEHAYEKNSAEDFLAVKKGLLGPKGKIVLEFGQTIALTESDQAHLVVAEHIDQFISEKREAFPVNFAAYKKLKGKLDIDAPYTKQEINEAAKRLTNQLIEQDDDIQRRVLSAYAFGLENA